MGKLINGIHGPYVGKVGSVIGSSWRGIPYIKSRGLRTKPATEGELINRFIFGKTQQWLFPINDFLRVGFKNYTLKSQGVSAAKSYLYKHALVKDGFDSTVDPTLMKVSHGDLPLPNNIEVELSQENDLIFTWETGSCTEENQFDQIILLAYDIEHEETAMSLNGQFRHTGRDILNIGESSVRTFVVYAAFIAADRESQSDSVYLGTFTRGNTGMSISKSRARTEVNETEEPPIPANQLSLFDIDEITLPEKIETLPKNKERIVTKKGRLTLITTKESPG